MIILGISCYYHDSSVCIVKDGRIIAVTAEERFTRKKHDNGFPSNALGFCLDSLGVNINEVDVVSFYEKPILKFDRVLDQHIRCFPRSFKMFARTIPEWLKDRLGIRKKLKKMGYKGKVFFVEHHLSHAAASFYASSFKKADILTIDGVGEWATTTKGFGDGLKINLTDQINFPHSLGLFYSTMTAYLGFRVNNGEYKVMGLAAYGEANVYREKISKLINLESDGGYSLDMKYFSYEYKDKMVSKKLCDLLGGEVRKADSKVLERHKNIAASVQELLEKVIFGMLVKMHKERSCPNLVLSGGVALNSVVNGKIINNTPYKKLFITPDPGDGGGSLGSALYTYAHLEKKRPVIKNLVYLGPDFSKFDIEGILERYSLDIDYECFSSERELIEKTVNLILKNKVIGWFQGRMEWGPRALGNRSILAQATSLKMKDIVNLKVKKRESFRPFAPVILEEYVKDYFEINGELSKSTDYMLMVYPVKEEVKKKIPAIVHVDGTGRLQTIREESNFLYYNLVKSYYKKTGIPVLLNTSFNIRGEPIVCTPKDAVKCFLGTGIDYLVIGNYLVKKRKNV
ncbi:carbamoyltransferase [Patescibacteria group bacterium]|nr:carbamoyltransferase [Patescibacteria group bacterium]MCG2702014.1 carbamoyltransferase [Candidatus Parcubacteria bacterium]MBU4265534.1 carbamoyltransferase [Patescibacteria group bacterium]MBU4389863.1 carbamoyltransferase [Patescibacteria group bacterium]MBU4397264.1 carbamoyltransferase [Patescibacteria group bacterium]